MKQTNLKSKLFFGYIGGAALLSAVIVAVSVAFRSDWYFHLVTPTYLYQQLLLTGIALGEWWQIALAGALLAVQIGGAILGICGQRKWAKALLLSAMIAHLALQLPFTLLYLFASARALFLLFPAYWISVLLNVALLALWRPMTKES